MATQHDELMKELLAAFPAHFLRLAAPRIADRIDLESVRLAPEEHYPGTPTGRERRPDLVSRARTTAGNDGSDEGQVLIHVEIELRYRGSKLPKLLDYHRGLSLKYALPVHTIVLYLRGGPPGSQTRVYEERSLGRMIGAVGYDSLGLSRAAASDYLARPEPLAWALAALMRPAKGQSRARLGLACARRIAHAPGLTDAERDLLFTCVMRYASLRNLEAPEFDKILVSTEDEEVRTMATTMVEWWKKKGLEQGREEGRKQGMQQGMQQGMREGGASILKRLLRSRFDQLPQWIDQRLEEASHQELEGWADRVLDAERLEDVFSSA